MNRFSVLLGAVALFSVAHAARPSYTFRYSTTHYVCQGGQRLDVTLISTLQSVKVPRRRRAGQQASHPRRCSRS
ncbi:hypothetical protein [Deinococcus ruber]|uniref:hypothetical protein n=1 Tax=Deinococcus ruber TaxID=1848197 RepID=UPI001E5E3B6B|nr:hypothetical protein [Deinococcus ruber]